MRLPIPLGQRPALEELAELRERPVNFDPAAEHPEADGWRYDDYRSTLPSEPPGPPVTGGSFEVAQTLLANYQVADPRIVKAYYDHEHPVADRDMLLELRFGPLAVRTGCRTGEITDERRTVDGREAAVWGWPYRTLEGHVEQGEMHWEVWKWLDTGVVEFHVHSYSRAARSGNPVVDLGFWLIGQRQRRRYLQHACDRMARLTAEQLAARPAGPPPTAAAPKPG